MRTWKVFPTAAVLLSLMLLPGAALAAPQDDSPAPESAPLRTLAWGLEAPWLGISWHGSVTLEETPPSIQHGRVPAVEKDHEDQGLLDAARRALKFVQAVLQFHASLLELASRHLS